MRLVSCVAHRLAHDAIPQLSNYNPTCHSGVGWSLSCPLAGHFGETSDQYKWLVADLAAVDRSVTPCVSVTLVLLQNSHKQSDSACWRPAGVVPMSQQQRT